MPQAQRKFIAQLVENEEVDEVFLASDKQLRPNRNGNLYLQMRLSDRTGMVNSMMWNATDKTYRSFENGDYLRVQGTTQNYNGSLQIIAKQLEAVAPSSVQESDFVQVSRQRREELIHQLTEFIRDLENPHLRSLGESLLIQPDLLDDFTRAPAAVKNHHAYQGGLLEHVVNLMQLSRAIAPRYPELNKDLLIAGALLHDIGKIREMTYDRHLGYTDEGQLVGHLVIGVEILNELIVAAEKLSAEPFPPELAAQLKHMIVSHHGQYEYGSPKVPMTLEAIALHLLDNLDAKLEHFSQLIHEDANSDSRWTVYHPALGRKIYKSSEWT
ncbi:MAG: HD domain-containing protein [Pirellulales bacterium]